MIKPKYLKPEDSLQIVAPCSPFDLEALEEGIALLENWGMKVSGPNHREPSLPFLYGSDQERSHELNQAFGSKTDQGVFCARGGYGSMRILEALDYDSLVQNPKMFMGYSDMTILLNWIVQEYQLVTFHGPVVAKDLSTASNHFTSDYLYEFLFGKNSKPVISKKNFPSMLGIKSGQAEGAILGGNLTMICSSLATPFEIQTKNNVLFLEEIGESPYRVDRLLMHLKLAGKLEGLRGLILGGFEKPQNMNFSDVGYDDLLKDIILDLCRDYDFPIIWGFPAGHCEEKITFPLGVQVSIDSNQDKVQFLEDGFSS